MSKNFSISATDSEVRIEANSAPASGSVAPQLFTGMLNTPLQAELLNSYFGVGTAPSTVLDTGTSKVSESALILPSESIDTSNSGSYRHGFITLNDEQEIVLPLLTAGSGTVVVGDNAEFADFKWDSTGTVSLTISSANVVTTNTDAKFCIYVDTGIVHIKNRLGSPVLFLYNLKYGPCTYSGVLSWTTVAAQLNSQTRTFVNAVFNNKIYAGTEPNGYLYEWNNSNAWVQVATTLNGQTAIGSLCVFNNELYAGTSPNGCLFKWNGTNAWVQVAPQLNTETNIACLCVHDGKLYGGTYPTGRLYEWNGTNAWVQVAPQYLTQAHILSMISFGTKLWASTFGSCFLLQWNGTAWIQKAARLNSQTYANSLCLYSGSLYVGTSPGGRLFRYDSFAAAWVQMAPQLGSETWTSWLVVCNGKLYASTNPNGCLYEFNGSNAWTLKLNIKDAQAYLGLLVYNNRIYAGTAPNGRLFKLQGIF
jgi:hypothetical protein